MSDETRASEHVATSKLTEPTRERANKDRAGVSAALAPILDLQRVSGNAAVTRLLRPLSKRRCRPLPQPARGRLERAFGNDLGAVRVETDAAEPAAKGAHALTTGNTISFAPGAFAPGDPDGFRVLAHETAHVVQQGRAERIDATAPRAASEAEAWQAADAAVGGTSAPVTAGQVVPPAQAADTVPMSPLAPRTFAIEMDWTPGLSNTSQLEFQRAETQFWNRYLAKWPEHLDAENKARIAAGEAPRVNETWIKYYPQDTGFMDDVLEHHHAGQSSRAVPMPSKLHDAYTVFHPKGTEVGEPTKPLDPTKPLPPLATRSQTEAEVARHTEEGRMGSQLPPGKPPPPVGEVPANSEVMSVPPAERRPIDQSGQQVIGGKTYPAERAQGETRYPRKAAPPGLSPEAQKTPLPPVDPAAEQDWSKVDPHGGPTGPVPKELLSKRKIGGATVKLGGLAQTQAAPAASPPPAPTPPAPVPPPEQAPIAAPAEAPPAPALAAAEGAPTSKFVASKTAPPSIANAESATGEIAPAGKPAVRPRTGLTSPALEEIKLGRARTVGTVVGVAGGLLIGWGLSEYKAWLQEALASAPPPEVEADPMRRYVQGTGGSMRILDLMATDIGGFGSTLEDKAQEVLGAGSLATLASAGNRSPTERIDALRGIQDGVDAFEDELLAAKGGIRQALELEAAGEERAAAATTLADWLLEQDPGMKNLVVWNELVDKGFGVEEILQMHANLRAYASRVRRVFRELHELDERTERTYQELAAFNHKLNGLYWTEVLQAARGASQHPAR